MASITFQVLDGIDKGRIFRDMETPVTIGREEGNQLRLNDERVSRFHAKVQSDNDEVVITDLDSTNGTRVNGHVVQIRRLHPGDRIHLGRSILLFGSESQILRRVQDQAQALKTQKDNLTCLNQPTASGDFLDSLLKSGPEPNLEQIEGITFIQGVASLAGRELPSLPNKMSPSQAARISELLDFLHRYLVMATENARIEDTSQQVTISFLDWQRILGVQMLLSRYVRAVAEPDLLQD